ncbi:hypothetical protein HZC21_00005 [Candidatus Peregrinibacteria bacterium]|nr:hypothetical protein [Candidatus Peregrinibacteria bacterium]
MKHFTLPFSLLIILILLTAPLNVFAETMSLEDCDKHITSFLASDEYINCVSQFAKQNNNISICSDTYPNSDNVRANCITSFAIFNKNVRLCDNIKEESENATIIARRDACIQQTSMFLKDVQLCNKIQNPERREGCFSAVARDTKDSKVCDLIKSRERDFCLIGVADKAKDPSVCNTISAVYERDLCISMISGALLDLPLCNQVQGESSRENCKLNIAVAMENKSLCRQLLDKSVQSNCLTSINYVQIQRNAIYLIYAFSALFILLIGFLILQKTHWLKIVNIAFFTLSLILISKLVHSPDILESGVKYIYSLNFSLVWAYALIGLVLIALNFQNSLINKKHLKWTYLLMVLYIILLDFLQSAYSTGPYSIMSFPIEIHKFIFSFISVPQIYDNLLPGGAGISIMLGIISLIYAGLAKLMGKKFPIYAILIPCLLIIAGVSGFVLILLTGGGMH